MNKKKLLSNMGLSALYKPISILLSFIYVPIVLSYLGEEKYGVWATILSVLSWITYFDIGIGNGMRNLLAESLQENDKRKCRKIVSSGYIILGLIIIILIVIAGIGVSGSDLKRVFNTDIQDNINSVLFISILFAAVSFWLSLCKSIFYALQKAHLVPLMGVFGQILTLGSVYVLSLYKESNLLYVALAYGISNLIVEIIFNILLFKDKKELRPSLRYCDKYYSKKTVSLGGLFLILQISALVIFTTDNIIITYFYGPTYVTYYSTVNKVFTGATSVITAFITPLWSAMTVAKKNNDYVWIQKIVKYIHLSMGPIIIALTGLAIIFKPIAKIWLGKELNYPDGLIGLMMVYSIVQLWCQAYSMLTNGLGLMKIGVSVAIIQGIVNIPLSVFLAEYMGMKVNGVLLGTILSLAISGIIVPIYVKKYLKIHRKEKEVENS